VNLKALEPLPKILEISTLYFSLIASFSANSHEKLAQKILT